MNERYEPKSDFLRAFIADENPLTVSALAEANLRKLLADPALVEPLRSWTEPSENDFLDRLARNALIACESGER